MLIYSNIKNSTSKKPLTVWMCGNPCLWVEPWYGWVCFFGTEFVFMRPLQLTNQCLCKNSHAGVDFILILPAFVSCCILLQETVISSQWKTVVSLCSRSTSPSLIEIDADSFQKSIRLFLSLWEAESCTGEVQGWEKLQMEKRTSESLH